MPQLISYPKDTLDLEYTLTCGQAFRWKLDAEGWWAAPVCGKLIRIKVCDEGFMWETMPGEPDFELVERYFALDRDVAGIYRHLEESDEHMKELIQRFRGLRILRQPPVETLLSYIFSTANSVPRISKSIEILSAKYGSYIASSADKDYYAFPDIHVLAEADPAELSTVGSLAWRGPNMRMVARQVLERPVGWLESLSDLPYEQAKAELMSLRGVGAKIADCICLFALGKDDAVPVDTHIRQVAVRFYMPELKTKTITAAAYQKIIGVFRSKFGQYAGWAQEFLYYEDLLRSRRRGKEPLV